MPFFKCAVCNVISPNLIAHDKHLSGQRHKRNEEAAAGAAPQATAARVRQQQPGGSAHAQKKQRTKERDAHAVSMVRV
jgi:hypothetical protein